MVVTQCRTCSTNLLSSVVEYPGGPGDLDPPLPKVPRPQKFPSQSVYFR